MSDSIYNNYRAQKALKCKSQISTFQIVNLYLYKFFFLKNYFAIGFPYLTLIIVWFLEAAVRRCPLK